MLSLLNDAMWKKMRMEKAKVVKRKKNEKQSWKWRWRREKTATPPHVHALTTKKHTISWNQTCPLNTGRKWNRVEKSNKEFKEKIARLTFNLKSTFFLLAHSLCVVVSSMCAVFSLFGISSSPSFLSRSHGIERMLQKKFPFCGVFKRN